eukprot:PhF_6_TR26712/c0_g1_i2/m.39072
MPSNLLTLADNEDIASKLERVYARLLPTINKSKKLGQIPSLSVDPSQYAKEMGLKHLDVGVSPISFQKLYDVKNMFELRHHDGFVGFPEDDFKKLFAPVFCESQDPNYIAKWFLMIDHDANGFVDWDEFSAYLMSSMHITDDVHSTVQQKAFCSNPVAPESSTHNPVFISKFAYNTVNQLYYTASVDGYVKTWDAKTLDLKGIVHYPDTIPIIDMNYDESSNRLLVLQQDNMVFLYDCSGVSMRQGHRLIRAFQLEYVSTETKKRLLERPQDPLTPQYEKTVEFDPTKMPMPHTMFSLNQNPSKRKGKRTVKTMIDVTWLDSHISTASRRCACKARLLDNLLCAEFTRGLFAQTPDTFLVGTQDGHLALYDYTRITTYIKPVTVWEPHTDVITKIHSTTENPQLQGVITSSYDCTVNVLDVEKNASTLQLTVDHDVTDAGGKGV